MRKFALLIVLALTIAACDDNDDAAQPDNVTVELRFTQNWDGQEVSQADFATTTYTNAHGEDLTIDRLRYLISDIRLENSSGAVIELSDYNFIDVGAATGLVLMPNVEIPEGTYRLKARFGFDDEDNVDGAYPDLNSVSWNVPAPMGGGYHYMQLEGKFINDTGDEQSFQYHTIRANDMSTTPITLQDTSIDLDLGELTLNNDASIEIAMNVAEWFKNPNEWDLNVLNAALMPNFDAQIMMNENGQNVFELGAVSQ